MAETPQATEKPSASGDDVKSPALEATKLGSATYEIIRQRLNAQGDLLRERMAQLNSRRQEVFGAIEFKLLQSDRITTVHLIPRGASIAGKPSPKESSPSVLTRMCVILCF